jgi:hypothetical protein
VSLDGKSCSEIAATVAKKLAPVSGHIVLLVLAMRAVWTGGRPENCGSSSGTRRCSWRTSPAAAVEWALATQTLSAAYELGVAVHRGRYD